MAKLDIDLSADFSKETPFLKLSGNLDFSLFSQTSAGKLRSLLFLEI